MPCLPRIPRPSQAHSFLPLIVIRITRTTDDLFFSIFFFFSRASSVLTHKPILHRQFIFFFFFFPLASSDLMRRSSIKGHLPLPALGGFNNVGRFMFTFLNKQVLDPTRPHSMTLQLSKDGRRDVSVCLSRASLFTDTLLSRHD